MRDHRREHDAKRRAEQPWRAWYSSDHWQAIRREQLARHPLCRSCIARGIVTPATICDHVEPHRGDRERFFAGPFQSLCKPCHDGEKADIERYGYSTAVGADGFPIDPKHPANREGRSPTSPPGVEKSAISGGKTDRGPFRRISSAVAGVALALAAGTPALHAGETARPTTIGEIGAGAAECRGTPVNFTDAVNILTRGARWA